MLIIIYILFFSLSNYSLQSQIEFSDNFNELTRNLIANLRVDPFLIGDASSSELSETSKEFIDEHIERYSRLALTSQQEEFSRSKRSLAEEGSGDDGGTEKRDDRVTDILSYPGSPTSATTDIKLFQQNSELYMVSLENSINSTNSDVLKIRKYKDGEFFLVATKTIKNGVRVATFPMENLTLIVVAENATDKNHDNRVYQFNSQDQLQVIQRLEGTGNIDVAIWEDNGNVFMSLVGFMGNSPVFTSSVPRLYEWRGRDFDVVQDVRRGAARISPFTIGDAGFVAVAHDAPVRGDAEDDDDVGEEEEGEGEGVYSEILKYNVNTEKYELFQKILTYSCDDIKYFEIDTLGESGGERETEKFLVVANFYKKDSSGKITFNTVSIIYKFVDNYFFPFQSIRLRGVKQWEPIKNKQGNLLLIALTLDGIKTFQYDGWHFIETPINFNGRPINGEEMLDVKTIHSYNFENKQLLVVARSNPSENRPQIFEIKFSTKNEVQQLHDELLLWCQKQQKVIENRDNSKGKRNRRESLDDDDNEDDELNSESQAESTDLEKLISTVDRLNRKLSTTEQKLKNSLQSREPHTIDTDIEAKQVLIKSTGHVQLLSSKKIDGVNVDDLLDNVLNINDNFEVNSEVKIDFFRTDAYLLIDTFNNHSSSDIIYGNLDGYLFNNVIIKGSAIFEDDLTISNAINNFTISNDALLLKTGNQNLANLRVSQIEADKVTTEALNGHKMDQINAQDSRSKAESNTDGDESSAGAPEALKEKVKRFKEVKAKNFIVGGFINDVDIPTLEKYALRKVGKQNITQTYTFDKVETESLDTDRLSGVLIPDQLTTTNNEISLRKSVIFAKPIVVKDVVVVKHLNSIPVDSGGDLEVLLKNVSTKQHVVAEKTFDNLELSNPINIQSKIKHKDFDKFNPITKISSNLNLTKSVTISGNVTVEQISKSLDIVHKDKMMSKEVSQSELPPIERTARTEDKNVTIPKDTKQNSKDDHNMVDATNKSLMRVVKHGLKLEQQIIGIPVKFAKELNVRSVEADVINGMDVSNFVVAGFNGTQSITGEKLFLGNLEITGNTVVNQINEVNSSELTQNILKKTKDQTVLGEKFIKQVTVLGSLKSNHTRIGKNLWKDVITITGNQKIEGRVTIKDISATSITVKQLETKGRINGVNLTELIEEAVPLNQHVQIFGTKSFGTLNVTHLWLNSKFDVSEQIKTVEDGNVELKNVNSLKSVVAKNVYFEKECNGLSKNKFGNSDPSDPEDTITVNDEIQFDTVTVLGTVFVQNNRLNHVDLEEFEENTVKIDEAIHFENADFGRKVIVPTKVSLRGQIEKLDLDNIFENGKSESQTMGESVMFQKNVIVNGTVHISGLLNNVNVTDLCGILSENKGSKRLVIEGNVHFIKGPKFMEFNNRSGKDLEQNIWFTDSPITLHGTNVFESNVTLRDVLRVEGLLNDINVKHLSDNYLSKTRNQTIAAHITFLNTTIFRKDIVTQAIEVDGLINDIKLDQFLKNTMLHRPQLFEEVLYLEEVTANHLEGNYLVNKLNLDSEVMRYDRSNLITGFKTFENLDVDVLRPEREGETTSSSTTTTKKPVEVQEVDVGQWLRGAVLKRGNFEIKGTKKFRRIEVNETSMIGRFNGRKLDQDNVMMKNMAQHITGKKTFVTKSPEGISFKRLEVKGHVNGENFEKLLRNQAFKNEDNTFRSPLKFCNNISVRNAVFEKRYSNVDVSDLLENITTLGNLNHIKEKYKNLTDMADNVEQSLKAQAYFLDYYKPVLLNFQTNDILSLKCTDSTSKIISFRNETGMNVVNFLNWDDNQEMFVNKSLDKNLGVYPNYLNKMVFENQEHIYMEHEVEISQTAENTHTGNFVTCNKGVAQVFREFLTKGSLFATSFEIIQEKLWCLLFVDFNFDINIPCAPVGGLFHRHQIIKSTDAIMASVAMFQNMVFLVSIHKGDEKKTAIWILNNQKQFEALESFREGEPISVSTVSSNQATFLAVAYKHVPNTKEFGKVIIRRFDADSKSFRIFQTIHVSSPTKVELALLPSKEIGLYVITENPSEPLTAYLYSGVGGFMKKIGSPTIPSVVDIHTFSFKNQHFVLLKHHDKVTLLQGVFKGSKFMED